MIRCKSHELKIAFQLAQVPETYLLGGCIARSLKSGNTTDLIRILKEQAKDAPESTRRAIGEELFNDILNYKL